MQSFVHDLIAAVHDRYEPDRSGDILRGIAPLEDIDPDTFGICLATADGYVYEVGDTELEFCIQSISKAFTYGIALTDYGTEHVDSKIDLEPSGDAFNEISLDPVTNRPRNPMINSGAIAASSMVAGADPAEQFARISRIYSGYAGRELRMDEDVFAAELATGHRNRAISHMLRDFEILECSPDDAIEVYLRQCSVMVSCRDLSLMGAALANGGVQPTTGEKVLEPLLAERVLSVMSTCGMYDAAGEWVASVGMAAKSGVGGGIVAVLPGQLAIAVFSPRLDQHGNSVRGVRACRRLSSELELHSYHVARAAHAAIRDAYDIVEAPSALQRPAADREILDEYGRRARIYEVHGDLLFSGAESVVRVISEAGDDLELLVLDVRRVSEVSEVARRLLGSLRSFLVECACEAAVVDPDGLLAGRYEGSGSPRVFATDAEATIWCEDLLLSRHGGGQAESDPEFDMADHPLLARVDPRLVDRLEEVMEPREYGGGEVIVAEGDERAGIFLVMSGRVRSTVTNAGGVPRTFAMLSPGTCFGDVYVATGNPHPATVTAIGAVRLRELTREAFAAIGEDDPALRAELLSLFMYAIHDDIDRVLGALSSGRVAPMTST